MTSVSEKNLKKPKSPANPSTNRRIKSSKFKLDKDTLAYVVLPQDLTRQLAEIDNIKVLERKMAEFLNITSDDVDLKEAAILDYYVGAFWWAKEQGFTTDQISAFFTVAHRILDNVRENNLSVPNNVRDLRGMLVGIGVESAETTGGLECFDVGQAKLIVDYCFNSVFQHQKLYEYLFHVSPEEYIIGTDLVLDVAHDADMPWPPALEEAMPEETYITYVVPLPSPPPSTDEEKAMEEKEAQLAAEVAVQEQLLKEEDLLSRLTPDEIRRMIAEVFDEMLGGLEVELAAKLREKENAFINKINKIHKEMKR